MNAALELVCAALLTAAIIVGARLRQLRWQSRRMRIALDNMSQGLCMFDGGERLVVCNQRYREMYGLSAEAVRPGITLTELLQARVAAGTLRAQSGGLSPQLLASLADGKIKVSRRPPPKDTRFRSSTGPCRAAAGSRRMRT